MTYHNFIKTEEIKLLKKLHASYGLKFLSYQEKGWDVNNDEIHCNILNDLSAKNMELLEEIKKTARSLYFRIGESYHLDIPSILNIREFSKPLL